MGRSIPVTLGSYTFPSKTAADKAIREIRDRYEDRVPILEDNAVDVLLGLVANHPQREEKAGAGVAGFFVAQAPEFNTRCFYVRRVDGTETDISWKEALTPSTPITRLRMACRNAINDQKLAYKDSQWPTRDTEARTCPISGNDFTRDEAHVDHEPPHTLKSLVNEWLAENQWTAQDVEIDHTGDQKAVDTFMDEAQRESWHRFHKANALLRLVSAEGNLRQGARLMDIGDDREAS
nr:DCL family protein [Chlorobaculum thiosulfatiphilum]